MKYLIALTVIIFSQSANAGCVIGELHFDQIDRLNVEIDGARQNLMALAKAADALDKMAIRVAHDDVEITFGYYAELALLSALQGRMQVKADRAVFDAPFTKVADVAATTASDNADFVTVLVSQSKNEAVVREATVMRDKLRQLEAALKCEM